MTRKADPRTARRPFAIMLSRGAAAPVHPCPASTRPPRWLDLGVQRIEDVAIDRALNGVEVPLYSYGKLVGTRRTYNDGLLKFKLRNRAPGRFAAGQPKALSAVDQMQLDRTKKQ